MAKARWRFGLNTAQVPSDVSKPIPAPALASADAKKFGLENFCNNCYANSVIQALYFCTPFRDLILQSPDPSLAALPPAPSLSSSPGPGPSSPAPLVPVRRKPERKSSTAGTADLQPVAPIPASPPSLFSALRSLFVYISTHPAERGTVSPRAFIEKLKEVNQVFNTTTHQDAHEFLNYLLNKIVEEVEEERARERRKSATPQPDGGELDLSNSITTLQSKAPTVDSSAGYPSPHATLVHKLFEGILTSETRCLTCETVTTRDESFLDLSIDIEQNSSVTACLRQFSASEMLSHTNKFFCDSCCDLQEAEKRMKIKRLPNVLALHLKRFKYQEDLSKYVKLAYRVAFPFELRLFNTVDEVDQADRLYNLFGIVVHIGNGPHHGHYVSIIKTLGTWLIFDDETVSPIAESDIPKYFGDSPAGSAYVLYYQAVNIDGEKLGLRTEHINSTATASNTNASPGIPNAIVNGHGQPISPPGLVPESIAAQKSSESSSDLTLPLSSFPFPPTISSPAIPIPNPTPPHVRAIPALPLTATPSSSSHSTSSGSGSSSSTTPPPSTPSISLAPAPALAPTSPGNAGSSTSKVAASMNNLLKTIRKSPSLTARAASAGAALEHPATPTEPVPPVPPLPPLPLSPIKDTHTHTDRERERKRDSDRERERGKVHSPRQFEFSASVSRSSSGSASGRPATAHAALPRTLPVPPVPLVRPVTSGGVVEALGLEDERNTGRREAREGSGGDKEKGGRNWTGWGGTQAHAHAHGVMSDHALSSMGNGGIVEESFGVAPGVGAGPTVHLNGSANGTLVGSGASEKEKEKGKEKDKSGTSSGGGNWFGKRKSFRITEKTLKGLVGSSSSHTISTHDIPPPSPTEHRDSTSSSAGTSWFRTSLHLPQRRGSESGSDAAHPPQMALSKSSPAPIMEREERNRRRPMSTNVSSQGHLHPNLNNAHASPDPRTALDGEASPAPSETSSLEYVSTGVSTPTSAVYPHPHPHPLSRTNGHALPLPPPPRILASASTAQAPVTLAHAHAHVHDVRAAATPLGLPHTRTLPDPPLTIVTPVTPERKKSLASFPVFRSRDKDKAKEKSREKEKVWDSVAAEAPSRPGSEHEREKTEDRPLPAVPSSVHVHGHESVNGHAGQRHQRQSMFGGSVGLVEVTEEPKAYTDAPGLASFGSANTSVASSTGGGGLKRAGRKLSLTAPMLGFGKKDKEKEKEKERLKEKAALTLSPFTRMNGGRMEG